MFKLSNIRGALVTMPYKVSTTGVVGISLFDVNATPPTRYPALRMQTGSKDPAGYVLVVNAAPLGRTDGGELPLDVSHIAPSTLMGEVVTRTDVSSFPSAAQARGCSVKIGTEHAVRAASGLPGIYRPAQHHG